MPGSTPNLNLPYPVPGDTVDVPRDVKALADAIDPLTQIPIGGIIMWPGAAAPNARWLLCQGQANISAATYPQLAAVLGQTGGFVNMPDFTDRFPAGPGATNGAGVLTKGPAGFANNGLAAATIALSMAQMPQHSHRADGAAGAGGVTGGRSAAHQHTIPGNLWIADVAGGYWTAAAGNRQGNVQSNATDPETTDHTHAINVNGGGNAHENRPPFLTTNYIIRAL